MLDEDDNDERLTLRLSLEWLAAVVNVDVNVVLVKLVSCVVKVDAEAVAVGLPVNVRVEKWTR